MRVTANRASDGIGGPTLAATCPDCGGAVPRLWTGEPPRGMRRHRCGPKV